MGIEGVADGKLDVTFSGNHVTLVSHSRGVQSCLEAAKELTGSGIDAEVINLRSLRPLGMLDHDPSEQRSAAIKLRMIFISLQIWRRLTRVWRKRII